MPGVHENRTFIQEVVIAVTPEEGVADAEVKNVPSAEHPDLSTLPFFFLNIDSVHYLFYTFFPSKSGRIGELRTQKLKSHLVRTQSLNVLPLKPGVGQYIAIQATLTARDFFLAYFYPSGPFICIFSKTSPDFSCLGCS